MEVILSIVQNRRLHFAVIALMMAVQCLYLWKLDIHHTTFAGHADLHYYASAAFKKADPSLFEKDPAYNSRIDSASFYHVFYTGSMARFLTQFYTPDRYMEGCLAFTKIVSFISVLFWLISAYWLFFLVTGNSLVATVFVLGFNIVWFPTNFDNTVTPIFYAYSALSRQMVPFLLLLLMAALHHRFSKEKGYRPADYAMWGGLTGAATWFHESYGLHLHMVMFLFALFFAWRERRTIGDALAKAGIYLGVYVLVTAPLYYILISKSSKPGYDGLKAITFLQESMGMGFPWGMLKIYPALMFYAAVAAITLSLLHGFYKHSVLAGTVGIMGWTLVVFGWSNLPLTAVFAVIIFLGLASAGFDEKNLFTLDERRKMFVLVLMGALMFIVTFYVHLVFYAYFELVRGRPNMLMDQPRNMSWIIYPFMTLMAAWCAGLMRKLGERKAVALALALAAVFLFNNRWHRLTTDPLEAYEREMGEQGKEILWGSFYPYTRFNVKHDDVMHIIEHFHPGKDDYLFTASYGFTNYLRNALGVSVYANYSHLGLMCFTDWNETLRQYDGLKEDIRVIDGKEYARLADKLRESGVTHMLLPADAVLPYKIVSENEHYRIFRLQ